MNLFKEFGLTEPLQNAINRLGFEKPTQIQRETIPHILSSKDVIGESATGSGKTLAFGCGVIENIIPHNGLQSLILTPTRELAEQVKQVLSSLSHEKKLQVISIYGGVAINPQMDALRTADVVVATPGRLLDHLQRRTIDLSKISLLVLDEADRMFDMGFIQHVERIIQACPTKRQTLFFSATISQEITRLSQKYMVDPVKITAKKQVDPSKLKQIYYNVSQNCKLSLLVHLFKEENSKLAMVFCNTRKTTEFVVKNLRANKVEAIAIHGGLTQNKRAKSLQIFDKGGADVLVCTDVAARGIHIDNISHVYNYEIPSDPTDYVHRIGRTARAGEEGLVVNLLCERNHDEFSRILYEYRSFVIENVKKPHVQRILSIKKDSFNDSSQRRGNFRRGNNSRNSFSRNDGRRSFSRNNDGQSSSRNGGRRSFSRNNDRQSSSGNGERRSFSRNNNNRQSSSGNSGRFN